MSTVNYSIHLSKFMTINPSQIENFNICAILLGGSTVYRHNELGTLNAANDWDGVIIVQRKLDIVKLINQHRQELCNMLNIKIEEYAALRLPEPVDSLFPTFDGVRFVGWTEEGFVKKGVKILSFEHLNKILMEDEPCRLNIISFKDVRMTRDHLKNGKTYFNIKQATCIDENLLILHESDICTARPCKMHGECIATFDVTTDLLMTGLWLYEGVQNAGANISVGLFAKFYRVYKPHLTLTDFKRVLSRCDHFQPIYNTYLDSIFETYWKQMSLKSSFSQCGNDACLNQINFIWGTAWMSQGLIENSYIFKKHFKEIEPKLLNISNKNNFLQTSEIVSTFSSNCHCGQLESFPIANDGKPCSIFWKQTDHWMDEMQGARLVVQYYPCTRYPIGIDPVLKILIYPFFKGNLLAERRLDYARKEITGKLLITDHIDEDLFIMLELQRAEHIFGAYCKSAKMASIQYPPSQLIHRFFYDRLINNKRMKQFYGHGHISLPGRNYSTYLTFDELMSKHLIINGKSFASLEELFKKAEAILHPDFFIEQLTVCGFGDGHCGNVLISDTCIGNRCNNMCYIDYEVAGHHFPLLDIAKPFYSDVFFNIFYADKIFDESLFEHGNVLNVRVVENSSIVVDFKIPKSVISEAIFGIKTRYILAPFLKFVKNRCDISLTNNWATIFGHALLCCALLARDFSSRPDVFFANLALGVTLSQISDISMDGHIFGIEDLGL